MRILKINTGDKTVISDVRAKATQGPGWCNIFCTSWSFYSFNYGAIPWLDGVQYSSWTFSWVSKPRPSMVRLSFLGSFIPRKMATPVMEGAIEHSKQSLIILIKCLTFPMQQATLRLSSPSHNFHDIRSRDIIGSRTLWLMIFDNENLPIKSKYCKILSYLR